MGFEKFAAQVWKVGTCHEICEKKHRRDGMSRLGTSRNVQWSAEGVTSSLCSRAHNLVNFSSLRWGYFGERTKKMKEFFLRKMKLCIFGRNPKASYYMTETLIVQRVADILASLCEGEKFSYLLPVRRKISYKFEKSAKKFRKNFSLLHLLKNPELKKFRNHFQPKT